VFTGLIEEVGHIGTFCERPGSAQLTIRADRILSGIAIGDSIAVSGACVTVVRAARRQFTVDLMPATLHSTTLCQLRPNDPVNLERALRAGDRYGGHFVTGHVDGIGYIVRIVRRGNAHLLTIRTGAELLRQMAEKGSVAVDGTSLTLFGVGSGDFTVSLIPHTFLHNVLGRKGIGADVNIECDVLQKYVCQQLRRQPPEGGLTMDSLRENGFV
jgi:riboflavin synthase